MSSNTAENSSDSASSPPSPAPPSPPVFVSPSVLFNSTPGVPRAHPASTVPSNPVVFFDISIGDTPVGRILLELYAHSFPHLCERFRQYCTGEFFPPSASTAAQRQPTGYKNTEFHRISADLFIQGGKFTIPTGLLEEDFALTKEVFTPAQYEEFPLERPGLLALTQTSGPTNQSTEFLILCKSSTFLNGKNLVFGQILEGLLVLRKVESIPCRPGTESPTLTAKITECGEM